MRRLFIVLLSLYGTSWAVAESPSTIASDDASLEPEVTIVPQGQSRVEEYRIKGQLYMIKVVPSKGLPYYLIDSDGDGRLETRRNDLDPDVVIPRWTLFEWH